MQPVDIYRRIKPVSYTGGSEVHWHQDGAEMWCPVGADLTTHPWFEVDLAPVRTPDRPPGSQSIAGLYYWPRTDSHVWFESQTEKDVLMWLDHEGVISVRSQPFAIVFSQDESPLAWHVPDFLLQHSNHDISLVDVRPSERITAKARAQFDATAAICDRIGIGYEVLPAQPGTATENLRWLKASRHRRCEPPSQVEDAILHFARGGMTRRALGMAVCPELPSRANSWIDNLAWRKRLLFDMSRPYSRTTEMTTAEDAR